MNQQITFIEKISSPTSVSNKVKLKYINEGQPSHYMQVL